MEARDQRSANDPRIALLASLESLRSWQGGAGSTELMQEVTAKALALAEELIAGKEVQLVIRLRQITSHAHSAVSAYSYVPHPVKTEQERVVDGMHWYARVARVVRYAALVGSPRIPTSHPARDSASGRFYPP